MEWPAFETERLICQPATIEDKALYVSLVTNAEVMKLHNKFDSSEKAERSFNYILRMMDTDDCKYVYWSVKPKSSCASIGFITMELKENNTVGDIGMVTTVTSHDKGYASEALLELSYFALETGLVKTIVTHNRVDHGAGKRLMIKLNFTHTGQQKLDGHLYNLWLFEANKAMKRNISE